MKQVRAEIYILQCLYKFSINSYKDFLLWRTVSFHADTVKKVNYPVSAVSSDFLPSWLFLDFGSILNKDLTQKLIVQKSLRTLIFRKPSPNFERDSIMPLWAVKSNFKTGLQTSPEINHVGSHIFFEKKWISYVKAEITSFWQQSLPKRSIKNRSRLTVHIFCVFLFVLYNTLAQSTQSCNRCFLSYIQGWG